MHDELRDELAEFRAVRAAKATRPSISEVITDLYNTSAQVSDELGRLGRGMVALRDEWAESDSADLRTAAARLNDLLCKRGAFQ